MNVLEIFNLQIRFECQQHVSHCTGYGEGHNLIYVQRSPCWYETCILLVDM